MLLRYKKKKKETYSTRHIFLSRQRHVSLINPEKSNFNCIFRQIK